jgi:hypothetical protein
VFFYPFTLCILLLAIGWRLSRRRLQLDRKDALGYYLLLVAGTWVAFPTDLLQTKQLSSLYGLSVIVLVSVLAVTPGTGGFLVYLYFSLYIFRQMLSEHILWEESTNLSYGCERKVNVTKSRG